MNVSGSNEPGIITCTLSGRIHGKEANPSLPEHATGVLECNERPIPDSTEGLGKWHERWFFEKVS
jgi:hypothetical protein